MTNTMSQVRVFECTRDFRCQACGAVIAVGMKIYYADGFSDDQKVGTSYYCSVECKQESEERWHQADQQADP